MMHPKPDDALPIGAKNALIQAAVDSLKLAEDLLTEWLRHEAPPPERRGLSRAILIVQKIRKKIPIHMKPE